MSFLDGIQSFSETTKAVSSSCPCNQTVGAGRGEAFGNRQHYGKLDSARQLLD